MASIGDRVLDNGLSTLTSEANRLDITSAEATTYTEATSTNTLGNTTTITISAPADRTATGGGRKVTLSAISGANVTANGNAQFYAITDTNNSRLLATGSLTTAQSVATGNTFSLQALDIGIPDPA